MTLASALPVVRMVALAVASVMGFMACLENKRCG
jgi:hypothetical protein